MIIAALGSIDLASVTVTDVQGVSSTLNGAFQEAMDGAGWRLTSTTTTYQVFHSTKPLVPLLAGSRSRDAQISRVTTSEIGSVSAQVVLKAADTLVLSVGYSPGWSVSYEDVRTGVIKTTQIERHDLVQAFTLPPGSWRITTHYHPKGLRTGLAVSAIGVVGLFGVASLLMVSRRRRRSSGISE